jgi:hypothetical protein
MLWHRGYIAKVAASVNDSRKFPWLVGLIAALLIATVLIAMVAQGTLQVINDFGTQVSDTSYEP